LAPAKSINDESKVRCKLKLTYKIINYDCKTFILQATDVIKLLGIFFTQTGVKKVSKMKKEMQIRHL